MINYDELNEIIAKLKEKVDNFEKMSVVQRNLESSLNQMTELKNNCEGIKNDVDGYSERISAIDDKYTKLQNNISGIMEDYVKLHNTFELLETQFKRINVDNETELSRLQSLINQVDTMKTNLEYKLDIQLSALEKIDKDLSTVNKKIDDLNLIKKKQNAIFTLNIFTIILVAISLILFFVLK